MAATKPPLILEVGEVRQFQAGDVLLDPLRSRAFNDIHFFANGEAGALAVGNICYQITGGVKKAQANAAATCGGILWISLQTPSGGGGSGLFQMSGFMDGLSGLTTGATYYLSPITSGGMTTTVPTTAGHYIIKLGIALSTTSFFFKIERPILLA